MATSPPERRTETDYRAATVRERFFAAVASDAPPRVAGMAAAWTRPPGGLVDGGEIVLLAIKPSMWRPLFDSTSWLITAVLLSVVLVWYGKPLPGLSLATSAQVIIFAGLTRLLAAIIGWVPTWYILTNRRIIEVWGVREPLLKSCMLMDVRNTYLSAVWPERWVGLGTITFVSNEPSDPPRVWRSISRSEEVHAKVRRAIENAIDCHHVG